MMTIQDLARLVEFAVTKDPPPALLEYCGKEYRPYYHLLYLLALSTPHKCVELGVEKGRGAFGMCLAGREVWGMDHTRRDEIVGLEARFPNFHYLECDSLPTPGQIPEQVTGPVGLLHIDTEHSYSMAQAEFWAYKPLLLPGSVICFDDTHAQEHAVGHFVTSLPWPTVFDDRLHECGYAVMVYDGERP